MKHVFLVSQETVCLLRRDRVFFPLLIIFVVTALFAQLASSWGIKEFKKILFDLGIFCYHILGVFVAVLWGTKIMSGFNNEGSFEARLTLPMRRYEWFLGSYLGLVFCLFVLAVSYLFVWQIFMLLNGFGWMTSEIFLFYGQTLSWLVVAAMTLFWGSFLGSSVCFFVSVFFWLIGMTSRFVFEAFPDDVNIVSQVIVSFISHIWDLQVFNLSFFDLSIFQEQPYFALFLGGQGLLFISFFLLGGALCLNQKDIH